VNTVFYLLPVFGSTDMLFVVQASSRRSKPSRIPFDSLCFGFELEVGVCEFFPLSRFPSLS